MNINPTELSLAVGIRLGIEGYEMKAFQTFRNGEPDYQRFYLHEDSERCFSLMTQHYLVVKVGEDNVTAVRAEDEYEEGAFSNVDYSDLQDSADRELATRIAILKALLRD